MGQQVADRARIADDVTVANLNELSAVEQRAMLGRKEVSARELLNAHLDQIESVNGEVNAVVALDA